MTIQFYDGDILFVGGEIAMHEDCCCGEGECATCVGHGCTDNCGPPCYWAEYEVENGDCLVIAVKVRWYDDCCWWGSGSSEPDCAWGGPGQTPGYIGVAWSSTYNRFAANGTYNYINPAGRCAWIDNICDSDNYEETSNTFTCDNGGTIVYRNIAQNEHYYFTFTPCVDCDDCPPA